jgi:hypothetical protein
LLTPFSPVGHGEDAEFIDRAEAVLDRADQAEAGMGVALEIEHGIDDVFEHARPGQRALLGHVADQDDRDAGLLGQPRQLRRAFAHLRHRPGATDSCSDHRVWIESITATCGLLACSVAGCAPG